MIYTRVELAVMSGLAVMIAFCAIGRRAEAIVRRVRRWRAEKPAR